MSAPNVRARSSVEVTSSCNGPFCCFGHKKHKKRSECDKKIADVVSAAQLQIVTPAVLKPIARHEEKSDIVYTGMPTIAESSGSLNLAADLMNSKVLKGDPVKFPV